MAPLTYYDLAVALLVNPSAAYYAIIAAGIVTLFYQLVLQPIVCVICARSSSYCSGRRNRSKSIADDDLHYRQRTVTETYNSSSTHGCSTTSSRRSSAARASGRYSTPNSAVSPRGSVGTQAEINGSPIRDPFTDLGAARDDECSEDIVEEEDVSGLVARGTAVRLYPASVSSKCTSRGSAGRTSTIIPARADPALREAMASGEVYYHPRNDLRVLSIEERVRGLIRRQQREWIYAQTNITRHALEDLYQRPAFQQWYGEHREVLLEEVQARYNGQRLRTVSSLAVILLAVFVLPAFSFINDATAVTGTHSGRYTFISFRPVPQGAPVSPATFAQLLATRASYVRSARTVATMTAESRVLRVVAAFVPSRYLYGLLYVASWAELIILVTAVVALITSTVMPRGRPFTAATGMSALAVVLAESAAVEHVSLHLGMGAGVAVGLVAASVVTALD